MYLREHFSACSEDRNSCNKGQVQAHRALQLLQQYLNTLSKTEHYSRQPKNAVAPRGRCNFTLSNRANLFYHIPYRLVSTFISSFSGFVFTLSETTQAASYILWKGSNKGKEAILAFPHRKPITKLFLFTLLVVFLLISWIKMAPHSITVNLCSFQATEVN